jgi:hypothetical protein
MSAVFINANSFSGNPLLFKAPACGQSDSSSAAMLQSSSLIAEDNAATSVVF